MATTSYADTTVGAVFLVLDGTRDDDGMQRLVGALRRRKEYAEPLELLRLAARYVEDRHWPLFVHEWAHILQAITYPALYLRCVREFRVATELVAQLRTLDEPVPFRNPVEDAWDLSVRHPSEAIYRVVPRPGFNFELSMVSPDQRGRGGLTETGLLEEDASIFQYKVEIDAQGTGADYRLWLRERSRYTTTFEFLRKVMGAEAAYVALPALVRAAFQTTWPVNVFVRLVEWTMKMGLDLMARIGTERLSEMMIDWLRSSYPSSAPSTTEPMDDKPSMIEGAWEAMLGESETHPLHPLARMLWLDGLHAERIRTALMHPEREFERRGGGASREMQVYWPPATVIRVVHPELRANDALILPSPALMRHEVSGQPGVSYQLRLWDVLCYKGFAFALAGFSSGVRHNCHHTSCPLYPAGLCVSWMNIPLEFSLCDFPGWLADRAERRVDIASGSLVRIHHQGGMGHRE